MARGKLLKMSKTKRKLWWSSAVTSDHNVNEFFPQGISIPDPPDFRTEVDHVLLKCNENKLLIDKADFWSTAKELVRVVALNRELPFNFSEFKPFSPHATLQGIVCGKAQVMAALAWWSRLITARLGSLKSLVAHQRKRSGFKTNDVITHVNGESKMG